MIFNYKGSKIFYRFINKKTDVVNVYLHGWGADYKSLYFCQDYLRNSALFVDFPPFGKSEKKIKDWTIFSYTTMVVSLCEHLNIHKVNLIGHSFGGRISILFSCFCKTRVNRLVLVDSAGLKPKRKLSYYIKVSNFKLRRKLHLDTSKYGSCDYLALDKDMRKVFNNIVKTNLDDFLENIEAKTLIIFGEKDNVTPLYMAKKFKKKIKNSNLKIIPNGSHFCFIDNRYLFIRYLKEFLEEV